MRTYLRSFAGGEISPEMFGRIDDATYQAGAARLRNLIVKPQGPVVRRPGSRFVRRTKGDARVRLLPFRYSGSETFCVQVGAGYFRFLHNGGTLLLSSEPRAYVSSKNLTAPAAFPGGDIIDFGTAHGLLLGDRITFTPSGSSLHTAINVFQDYAVIVVSSSTIKIAVTVADALAGTAITLGAEAGAAGRVHFVYEKMDLTRYSGHNFYCLLRQPLDTTPAGGSPASVTFSGITISHASHGFAAGTAIVFSGSTLPPQITAGTVYYVLNPTGGSYTASATPGGAGISTAIASGTVVRATHWYLLEDDNTVVTNGSVYEIPNDYGDSDLDQLDWDTSYDILSIATAGHPLSELRRYGSTQWSFDPVVPGQTLATPAQPTVTPTYGTTFQVTGTQAPTAGNQVDFICGTSVLGALAVGQVVYWSGGGKLQDSGVFPTFIPQVIDGNNNFWIVSFVDGGGAYFRLKYVDTSGPLVWSTGPTGPFSISGGTLNLRVTTLSSEISYYYVVTAVDTEGRETTRSTSQLGTNNLFVEGAYNTISWTAVPGAQRYRIYRQDNGLFSFIGEVDGGSLSFKDDAVTPNAAKTPPILDTTLSGLNYPRAVAHFEQRRTVGGMVDNQQRWLTTRTGTETDFSYHLPVLDDDRISVDIASREAEIIQHIVPLSQLLLLTSAGEYRVATINSDALTPSTVSVRPQSYVGASIVQPEIVNNSVVFCAVRGGHVRELGYQGNANGWQTGDLSLRAAHLFDDYQVKDMTQAKAPLPVLWFVSTSGDLLGLTYVPEEGIGAWHTHTTDGTYESCRSVSEGSQDSLYTAVLRHINGVDVRFIEWTQFVDPATVQDAYYVDAGLSYTNATGSPVTVVSGLTHLALEVVSVLNNGLVESKTVSAGGQVTLSTPLPVGKTVHIGLPIVAELQTLPLLMQVDGYGAGRAKNISKVWLRVFESCRFYVGPNENLLVPELNTTAMQTKAVRSTIPGEWAEDGQILVRQSDPLPLTIVGMTLEVSGGG